MGERLRKLRSAPATERWRARSAILRILIRVIVFIHVFNGSYALIPHRLQPGLPLSLWPFSETVALASIPLMINYQGRLTDSSNKVVNGTYTMTFRLYDASTSGNEVWKEQQTVTLTESDNGIFNVVLGSVTSMSAVDFNNALWLSVQVADDSEMSPRQRLTASGYSVNADQLDSLDSTKFLRTDVDTSTSGKLTITRAGAAFLIKPSTDPAADTKLIDVQNAAGTSKFSVDIEGDTTVAGDLSVTGSLTAASNVVVTNPSSAQTIQPTSDVVPLTLKGKASGTAKVLSIYDAGATPAEIASFDSNGKLTLAKTPSTTSPALVISAESSPGFSTSTATQLVLSQASGGTNNFIDAQVGGSSKFSVDASGNLTVAGTTSSTGATTLSSLTVTGASNLRGAVSLGNTSGGTAGSLLLYDNDASSPNAITVSPPSGSSLASSYTLTLPVSAGSNNQVLTTDGSGSLSWQTPTNITGVGDVTDVGDCSSAACFSSGGSGTALTFRNATSGTVTLQTVSGALGSRTISLPAMTGTVVTTGDTGTVTGTMIADGASGVSLTTDVTGTLPIANGGTNATTATTAFNNLSPMTTMGDLVYYDGTNNVRLAGNTSATRQFLTQTGTGSASAAPAWAAVASSDVSSGTLSGDFIHDTTGATDLATTGSPLQLSNTGSSEALMVATDPTASAADGVLKLGRVGSAWAYMWFDNSARSGKGEFVFSASQRILGSSPSAITFGDGANEQTLTFDSTASAPFTFSGKISATDLVLPGSSPAGITFGSGANAQTFSFDPNAGGAFSFSGGVFAQQFRNLVKNGSFEAFSQLETFKGSTATGGTGGAGSTFQGGWANFSPDEWLWDAGKVYQNAPTLFTPGTTITATNLQQDFYHGKSAVTLEDDNLSAANTYNDTVTDYVATDGSYKDAHIEQTVTGLKPQTVYSVGAYMLARKSDGSAATATTEAILDVTGEETTLSTTLRTALTSSATTVEVANAADLTPYPDSGVLLIGSERISYAGKDTTNKKFTFCIRGFEGTTAAVASVGATVKIAPFKHLTTSGSTTLGQFTLYKSQFSTNTKAGEVKLHLACKSVTSGDQCRFDAVQVVEGRSVPEFQPSAIIDTGDQTLYGSMRMGRTSDGRGGILSVDKALRTRAIELFDKDPGLSGTTGGFGGVGPTTKIVSAATSTATLTSGGSFFGTLPREMRVTITDTTVSTNPKFKWEYRDCPAAGCGSVTFSVGGSNLLVTDYQSLTGSNNPIAGSQGVNLAFSSPSSTTFVLNDQWSFMVAGASTASQYDSFSGTAAYQPGQTFIYKDPYNSGKLTFVDGINRVTLEQIVQSGIGSPARVDFPTFFPASTGGGKISLDARDGFKYSPLASQPDPITFDVQITTDGVSPNPDKFSWRDNIINGGNVAAADWDGQDIAVPSGGGPYTPAIPGGGGATYGFTLYFNSPDGTYRDGNAGDRWQFKAYKSTATTNVKNITSGASSGITVTTPTGAGNESTRDLALKLNATGPGVALDANGLSLLRTCAANQILKWSSGTSSWACADDVGASGDSGTTGTSNASFKIGSATDAAASDVTLQFGNTNAETIRFSGSGASAAADIFEVSDTINIPSGEKYKINGSDLNFTDLAGSVTSAMVSDGTLVDADIAATAAIADTKLATISTANKVSGSAIQLAAGSGLDDSSGLRIAAAAAGNGLGGGGGSALAVNTDNSTVEINADTLRVKAAGITANELGTGAVTSVKVLDGTLTDADVSATAAIAGTKVTPDFGSQNILTTGTLLTPYAGGGRIENLILQSETFDNASWVKSANTTVTADAAAANPAPDGLTTADTIAFAAAAGTDTIQQASATAAASTQFTASIWLKAASAQTVRLGVIDQAGTPAGTYATASVTTSWQRFSVTNTFAAGATGNAVLILDDNNVAGAVTVYAWAAQLEKSVSTPSIYTRTTSAAHALLTGLSVPQDLRVTGNLTVDGTFNQSVSTGDQTLSGNLVVNGNTTLGDAATDTVTVNAGKVSLINSTSAANALEFGSGANLANLYRSANDTLKTDDALIVTGATTLSSTLGVTGATTLSSTLGVAGDLLVNTNKFTVTAASGNTSVAGTLGVTGATTLARTSTWILELKPDGADTQGDLRFYEKGLNGSNFITLISPAALGADYTLTLPTAIGTANQVLTISSVAGSNATLGWANGLTNSLASANIFVGNASNIATSVPMTGDVTIDNAGATTIGTGKVNSAKILDNEIVNADIAAAAAIAGTKIDPNFGSQAVVTTGTLAAGATSVSGNLSVRKDDKVVVDSNDGSDSYMAYNSSKNYVSLFVNGNEVARLKQ